MVGMDAVLVVAAIAVAGAVVARVTWRRPGDERHSIQSHQQTLETLRAMADRRPNGLTDRSRRPDPDQSAGAQAGAPGSRTSPAQSRAPGPARAGQTRSGAGRSGAVRAPTSPPSNGEAPPDLVFGDDVASTTTPRPPESARSSMLVLPRGLPRAGRRHRRNWQPRRGAGTRIVSVVGAVVILGAVVGVALVLAPSHHVRPPSHQSALKKPKTSAHGTKSHPTTTVPPEVEPTASTAITAAYGAPSTNYTVGIQATGLCWVEATQASTGKVVWTGTLTSGQSHSIPASGNLVLRLGAANDVSVTMNGEPVVLPPGFHSPFDLSFNST